MVRGSGLGRSFGWLWAAYAVSTVGTFLALDAFALVALLALHAGAAQVAFLAAAGRAVGALVAVPVAPWLEFRRKRPVMIAMDVLRFAALATLPVAYALGRLTFGQLLAVAVILGAGNIVFKAASGAYLKTLVRPEHLLTANGRFEATTWTATALGPPLGGAAIGAFGPLTTVAGDAVSFLLSALGLGAIRGGEPRPPGRTGRRRLTREVLDGWRHILGHDRLRPLFVNTTLVNGLIMATAPPLATLMLRDLGFAPWQYGLAFAVPCLGGLVGSRLSGPLVARYGRERVLRVAGAARACWPVGLVFTGHGWVGLAVVMVVEGGLITSVGIFNPVFATCRLEDSGADRVSRTLSAWSITGGLTTAALTVIWGLMASLTSTRVALAAAGLLLLATPFTLPRRGAQGSAADHPAARGDDDAPTAQAAREDAVPARAAARSDAPPAEAVGEGSVRAGGGGPSAEAGGEAAVQAGGGTLDPNGEAEPGRDVHLGAAPLDR